MYSSTRYLFVCVCVRLFVLVIGSAQLSPLSTLLLGFFLFSRGRANNSSLSLLSVCKRHMMRGRKKEHMQTAATTTTTTTTVSVYFYFYNINLNFLCLIFSRVQLCVSSPRVAMAGAALWWRGTGVSQSFAIFVVDM